MSNPKTLIEAYSLAKIQEENILNNGKGGRPWLTNLSKNSMVGGNAEVVVSSNKGVGTRTQFWRSSPSLSLFPIFRK
jgi:hypothetical protein